jgi:hypothetical protein
VSASRSTYQVDLSGSIDGVSTLGSDDTYTISNATGLQAGTYVHGFIVVNALGVAPVGNRFIIAGTTGPSLQIRHLGTTGTVALAITGVGAVATTGTALPNGLALIEYRHTTGSQYVRINQGTAATGTTASTFSNPVAEIIGSFGGSFEGDIYCWYGWKSNSAALPAQTITDIRTQLGVEFGQAWS